MSPDPSQLRVIECTQAHRPTQARLASQCFRKPVDAGGLEWRYQRNPQGESLSFAQSLPDGTLVSGYACNPRRVLAFGEPSTAATLGETGDVMTHPDWRKLGLFSALDAAARARSRELGWPAIFGLPNQRSAHIFLELGWQEVGRIAMHTHVLHSSRAVAALCRPAGRLAALCVPLDAWRARRARARLETEGAGWRVEPIEQSFPPEVDGLSRRVARQFAWMVERSAEYLCWRFLESPSGLHRALALRSPEGALGGYVVVQLPRPGERVGYLVDLLAAEPGARSAGLLAGLERLRAAGAWLVQASAVRASFWEGELLRAGFRAPRRGRELSVILFAHQPEHPLSRAGRQARDWYLTDGDRDDETMG